MHAIFLRTAKVKDSDLAVNLLTGEDLLLAAYANHYQHSKSFPNGLELMTVYDVELGSRPEQRMASMRSAYSEEQFDHIACDMRSYSCASAMFEAISNICPEHSTVSGLFSNLLTSLAIMNTEPSLSVTVLSWFECYLFAQLGAMPNLELCSQCGRTMTKSSYFQQETGFVCTRCAGSTGNIPSFVLEAVRRLRCQSLRTTAQRALEINDDAQRRKVLAPVVKFLAAVMCDSSPIKRLKAHRFMADAALNDLNLLNLHFSE